ncbi:MAG: HopJ type III effector protein [Gammaproteobacteria bacterium]|jgi:hypothetical protein
MTLDDFIFRLGRDDSLMFEETLAIIDANYDFTPTAFSNGVGDEILYNAPDQNQGSCRLFAFGKLNGLDEKQLLACFGEHYRQVLADPGGEGHANIRTFMRHGWKGICFEQEPLRLRQR